MNDGPSGSRGVSKAPGAAALRGRDVGAHSRSPHLLSWIFGVTVMCAMWSPLPSPEKRTGHVFGHLARAPGLLFESSRGELFDQVCGGRKGLSNR